MGSNVLDTLLHTFYSFGNAINWVICLESFAIIMMNEAICGNPMRSYNTASLLMTILH